jgi:hypothetical protein
MEKAMQLAPVSVQQQESAAIMSVIERVAMSPDADIEKLERMLDMQERVLDRNAKQAFTADLASMQIKMPRVVEHGTGHNNAKFAKLEDINDAIRPVLQEFGFAVTFRIKHEGALIHVCTVLSHRQGHSEETTIVLPADTGGSKNAVQAIGSTISYGKRYGVCALLNISTGDDVDGNGLGAMDTINSEQLGELLAAIKAARTTEQDFCKSARISLPHELQAIRFDGAMNNLRAKAAKAAQ